MGKILRYSKLRTEEFNLLLDELVKIKRTLPNSIGIVEKIIRTKKNIKMGGALELEGEESVRLIIDRFNQLRKEMHAAQNTLQKVVAQIQAALKS